MIRDKSINLEEKTEESVSTSEKKANQNEIFEYVKNRRANTDNKYDEISVIQKNFKKMELDIISETTKNQTDIGDISKTDDNNNQEEKDLTL